jgi:hypothetical protein
LDPQLHGKASPSNDDVFHDLARTTHQPVEEVKRVYERQMAALEVDARVTTFLPVFAKRRTREELDRRPH